MQITIYIIFKADLHFLPFKFRLLAPQCLRFTRHSQAPALTWSSLHVPEAEKARVWQELPNVAKPGVETEPLISLLHLLQLWTQVILIFWDRPCLRCSIIPPINHQTIPEIILQDPTYFSLLECTQRLFFVLFCFLVFLFKFCLANTGNLIDHKIFRKLSMTIWETYTRK